MRCVDARPLVQVLTDLVSHLLWAVLSRHVGRPVELTAAGASSGIA
jgi:hypothetical protein